MSDTSVLFILKYNEDSAGYAHGKSSGLFNSAKQVVSMLRDSGVNAAIEIAVDGNCIDKFVTKHKPALVILEALWCPPSKIAELQHLHPKLHWAARIHSEIPFLANEGIAIEWIKAYAALGVYITANSDRASTDLEAIVSVPVYLPNYYNLETAQGHVVTHNSRVHIGCFGAVRPMKNHLVQALAAIEYARKVRRSLSFHINGTRVEQGGQQALKNLQALFQGQPDAVLVEHPWMPHEEFVKVVASMDLCFAVSLSETFNIVTADAVLQNVPVVVSPEVRWLDDSVKASPTSVPDIVRVARHVMGQSGYHTRANRQSLYRYNRDSRETWLQFIGAVEKRQSRMLL